MSHYLDYAGSDKPQTGTNCRDSKSGKTMLTDDGPLRTEVWGNPEAEFEPRLEQLR
jgi:hypothetical protein